MQGDHLLTATMRVTLHTVAIFLLVAVITDFGYGELVVYPRIPGVGWSGKFTVYFKQGSGKKIIGNQFISTNTVKFNKTSEGAPNRTVSWHSFMFTGEPVTVEVHTQVDFQNCTVRPQSYGFNCVRIGTKTAQFNVTHNNRKMSVEFDYDYGSDYVDIQHKLLIFADAPETNIPKNDSSVLYYGPGLHDLHGQKIIDSHITTVYLAPGALCMGGFITTGGSVKIMGRGILAAFWYEKHSPSYSWAMINMDAGSHHTIEGITIVDPSVFYIRALSDNLVVRNVKALGAWTSGTDGIETGNNALVEDSFIMANDDTIKIYNSNMIVRRSVIWQSLNGAVFQFGWWHSHNISNIRVSDIDIIHTDWCAHDGGTSCTLSESDAVIDLAGNSNVKLSDMEFRDIRIESTCPRVLNFLIHRDSTSNVSNVRLVNWSVEAQNTQDSYPNQMAGSTPNGIISKWYFYNFKVGGICITSGRAADFLISRSDVHFMCSNNPAIVG